MASSVEFKNRINELVNFEEKEKVKTCKIIGVDAHTITLAKEYGVIPSTLSLVKIADYCKTSVDFLLGYTEDDSYVAPKTYSTFAERLKSLIEKDENTPYKLSQMWHLDKSYITKWLQGKYVANVTALEIIADYFEVSIDYLLGRAD